MKNSNLLLTLGKAAIIVVIIFMFPALSYGEGLKHYQQGKCQVVEIPLGTLQAIV